MARAVSLDVVQLESGLTRAEADRFLCRAYEAVGDPSFGLKAGTLLRPERMGVSGWAAMTSPTFGVALHRKARYNRLVWGDGYELVETPHEFTVKVVPLDEGRPYGAAKVDMELSSLLAFGRQFTGVPVVPLRVTVRQAPPAYQALYGRILGIEPVFAHAHNSISFRRQDTDLRLISANEPAHAGLSEAAETELAALADGTLAREVRAVLQRMMAGDEPTLGAVARAMLLSGRTLQRRLAVEGCSFSALLDEVRQETALRKLRLGRTTVPELAFLLGFADANSFYRAFKRWTGMTPELYRREGAAVTAAPGEPARQVPAA